VRPRGPAAAAHGRRAPSRQVGTDYLIKCHVNNSIMIQQVSDGNDHNVFFTSPYQSTQPVSSGGGVRPIYDGAQGDIKALAAAALALMSRLYKPYNAAYAATCLTHAEQLYTMALVPLRRLGSPGR
jgi:hypothetical protein